MEWLVAKALTSFHFNGFFFKFDMLSQCQESHVLLVGSETKTIDSPSNTKFSTNYFKSS